MDVCYCDNVAALAECKAHTTLSSIDPDGQRKTAPMVESKPAYVCVFEEEILHCIRSLAGRG